VVASGHGALAEKVRHEVDGLLFPPGNAAALYQVLQQILAKPELLSSLRQNVPAPMGMEEHVRELQDIYCRFVPVTQA
jgi:glycosyltransferase involved in cell wall biosynthesis